MHPERAEQAAAVQGSGSDGSGSMGADNDEDEVQATVKQKSPEKSPDKSHGTFAEQPRRQECWELIGITRKLACLAKPQAKKKGAALRLVRVCRVHSLGESVFERTQLQNLFYLPPHSNSLATKTLPFEPTCTLSRACARQVRSVSGLMGSSSRATLRCSVYIHFACQGLMGCNYKSKFQMFRKSVSRHTV